MGLARAISRPMSRPGASRLLVRSGRCRLERRRCAGPLDERAADQIAVTRVLPRQCAQTNGRRVAPVRQMNLAPIRVEHGVW
jgi:hypothetical protein